MYLTPTEARETRLATLDNLNAAAQAYADAGAKLAGLAFATSLRTFEVGHARLAVLIAAEPAAPLASLDDWRALSARFADDLAALVADTRQTMLDTARAQLAVVDGALANQVRHAAESVPPEGEALLEQVTRVLHQAESSLNGLADATLEGVGRIERQVRQVTAALAAPARRPALPGTPEAAGS